MNESRASAAKARAEKGLERLVLFTDAVIAIVITLMVLEVKPPHVTGDQQLLAALGGLWHEYLAVGMSFWVIGFFWTRHHHRFQWVARIDDGLIYFNLLFLLAVAAIPFATAVLAQHPQQAGTILYAAIVATASLIAASMWAYANKRQLMSLDLPPVERRSAVLVPLTTALAFLISIPIALWNADAAKFSWLAALVVAVASRVIARRPRKNA